jgi:hypothetical protein
VEAARVVPVDPVDSGVFELDAGTPWSVQVHELKALAVRLGGVLDEVFFQPENSHGSKRTVRANGRAASRTAGASARGRETAVERQRALPLGRGVKPCPVVRGVLFEDQRVLWCSLLPQRSASGHLRFISSSTAVRTVRDSGDDAAHGDDLRSGLERKEGPIR